MGVMMKKFLYRFSGFLFVWLLSSADVLAQCAMCRGSVQSTLGNGRNNVGVGINTGIAYLFVIPYLSAAFIAYFWYRSATKATREKQLVAARAKGFE